MIEMYFKRMGSCPKNIKIVNISIEKTIEDLKEKVKKIFHTNRVSITDSGKIIMKNNKITIKDYLNSDEGQHVFKKPDTTQEKISFKLDQPLLVSILQKETVK